MRSVVPVHEIRGTIADPAQVTFGEMHFSPFRVDNDGTPDWTTYLCVPLAGTWPSAELMLKTPRKGACFPSKYSPGQGGMAEGRPAYLGAWSHMTVL